MWDAICTCYLVLSSGKRHSSREVCWVLAEMFEAHWRAFAFAPQPPFPAPAHQPTPQIHQLAHLDQPPLRAGGANNFQSQQLDRPKGFYLFFIGHRMLPKAVFSSERGETIQGKITFCIKQGVTTFICWPTTFFSQVPQRFFKPEDGPSRKEVNGIVKQGKWRLCPVPPQRQFSVEYLQLNYPNCHSVFKVWSSAVFHRSLVA